MIDQRMKYCTVVGDFLGLDSCKLYINRFLLGACEVDSVGT